jgi:hypothetical protein
MTSVFLELRYSLLQRCFGINEKLPGVFHAEKRVVDTVKLLMNAFGNSFSRTAIATIAAAPKPLWNA